MTQSKLELEAIGLSPNEAKCYIALLRLGTASANELSRASGIHRVSVYDALRGLREKALISQILKTNKIFFEAANPSRIKELIEEKEKTLAHAKKIIPSLLASFHAGASRQEIHSYKGTAGIKTILKEMLTTKTEILDFGAEFKIKKIVPTYYPSWDHERIKKKIHMRIIANEKIKNIHIPLTKIKFIPKEFASSVSTYLFDNKVALLMWTEEPMGILIEHKEVYDSYKNYFEYLWKNVGK